MCSRIDGIQVEDRLRLGVVALADIIAGQTQQILDTEGGCAEDVALDGDAIAITATDLTYRREAGASQAPLRRRRWTYGNWRRRRQ